MRRVLILPSQGYAWLTKIAVVILFINPKIRDHRAHVCYGNNTSNLSGLNTDGNTKFNEEL